MSKIPTVEKWLNKHALECIEKDCVNINELKCIMIHFAREHVEAALKEASEKAVTDYEYAGETGEFDDISVYDYFVDKKSILNAYPLENVK